MLTGDYARRASCTYKTVEGRDLLAAVRSALKLIDAEMAKPSSVERGKMIASICSGLEMAADRYDLFGEKDRRKRK